jgi:alkylhydroperoxidase/carboxymuconolactone decarboxylase family protein YurZ
MRKDDQRSKGSEVPDVNLPDTANAMTQEHPTLWRAFQQLGKETGQAGPLDDRTRRLVHLAFAIASDSEGATHSHVRRAVAEGIGAEELDHVALLAVTTLGWPQAMKGLSWVRDVTRG